MALVFNSRKLAKSNGSLYIAGSYLNWGLVNGASGYGIRDSSGQMQFKDSGGTWTAFQAGAATNYWARTGTTLNVATAGDTLGMSLAVVDNAPIATFNDSGNTLGGNATIGLGFTGASFVADYIYLTATGVANNILDFAVQRVTSGGTPVNIMSVQYHDHNVVMLDFNALDVGTHHNTISGGGDTSNKNLIGTPTKPYQSQLTPIGWANDTDYVDDSANYATISGGYDHVNNQLAGTITGGGHNFIKYNASGHSVIGGGSYNLISGLRSGIFSGRGNTITGATSGFSGILGGDNNNIVGSYSAILGGLSNAVTGDYGLAFGRRAKVTASGAIALSDATDADFANATANSMAFRYAGGYVFTGAAATTFDGTVASTGFLVGAAAGVDGTFTTVDSKTVTVTKGIVTGIA